MEQQNQELLEKIREIKNSGNGHYRKALFDEAAMLYFEVNATSWSYVNSKGDLGD